MLTFLILWEKLKNKIVFVSPRHARVLTHTWSWLIIYNTCTLIKNLKRFHSPHKIIISLFTCCLLSCPFHLKQTYSKLIIARNTIPTRVLFYFDDRCCIPAFLIITIETCFMNFLWEHQLKKEVQYWVFSCLALFQNNTFSYHATYKILPRNSVLHYFLFLPLIRYRYVIDLRYVSNNMFKKISGVTMFGFDIVLENIFNRETIYIAKCKRNLLR